MLDTKIPSEIEGAPHNILLALFTLFSLLTLFTLLTLFKQLMSKEAILPLHNVAVLLYELLVRIMEWETGYNLDC